MPLQLQFDGRLDRRSWRLFQRCFSSKTGTWPGSNPRDKRYCLKVVKRLYCLQSLSKSWIDVGYCLDRILDRSCKRWFDDDDDDDDENDSSFFSVGEIPKLKCSIHPWKGRRIRSFFFDDVWLRATFRKKYRNSRYLRHERFSYNVWLFWNAPESFSPSSLVSVASSRVLPRHPSRRKTHVFNNLPIPIADLKTQIPIQFPLHLLDVVSE